ncbi:M28 family peptidase [Erythrobacter dokdonensis]|uniref:Peptidase M28 n=1 Tax=Erythrobacter dokdonensis DSW-74 TaxID=1300349 RepID=A0A1A7BMP9_9SPHN|nr:M28 family peptidase [Erythrobacter dokdonensis]OBV12435.1 Peptidase M28 [Erythrobacter dokdonensis DSW-74]
MSVMRARHFLVLLACLVLAACARAPVASVPVSERAAIEQRLRADIAVLASDAFGGRKPGTPGEERTLAYLEGRFAGIGLLSGTGDPGSYWRAPVDLVSARPLTAKLMLARGRNALVIPEDEGVAFTRRRRALAAGGPATGVPVVFVGTGEKPVAPETVAGAVVVLLGADGPDPSRKAASLRERATAVLTVLPDADAIAALRAANAKEKIELASEEVDTLSAYVTEGAMARALGEARWKRLKQRSEESDFTPIEIQLAISIEATAERREFASANLIGLIPGTAPGSGAVLLLGHWDHLGECGPPDAAERVCNGAVDNASGIAVMLELARRLKAGPPLGRDIYVMATSAEEVGLLGARAFAAAPPVPLGNIVAAFNLDMLALAPAGAPVGFVGEGRTPLDPVILAEIARSGRSTGDRQLAESFVSRQDGWVLLENGVPSVLLSNAFGSRSLLRPFLQSAYHRPSDDADAVELGGAIDDLLLHEALVRVLADPARYSPPAAAQP